MQYRISSPTPGYFRWLWIREPRQQLAYALRDLSDALARLADRLDGDEATR